RGHAGWFARTALHGLPRQFAGRLSRNVSRENPRAYCARCFALRAPLFRFAQRAHRRRRRPRADRRASCAFRRSPRPRRSRSAACVTTNHSTLAAPTLASCTNGMASSVAPSESPGSLSLYLSCDIPWHRRNEVRPAELASHPDTCHIGAVISVLGHTVAMVLVRGRGTAQDR